MRARRARAATSGSRHLAVPASGSTASGDCCAKPAIASSSSKPFEEAQRVARRREGAMRSRIPARSTRRSCARATERRPVRSRGRSRAGSTPQSTSSRSSIDLARSNADGDHASRRVNDCVHGFCTGPKPRRDEKAEQRAELGGRRARRQELVRHVGEDDEADRGLFGDEAPKRSPDRHVVVVS